MADEPVSRLTVEIAATTGELSEGLVNGIAAVDEFLASLEEAQSKIPDLNIPNLDKTRNELTAVASNLTQLVTGLRNGTISTQQFDAAVSVAAQEVAKLGRATGAIDARGIQSLTSQTTALGGAMEGAGAGFEKGTSLVSRFTSEAGKSHGELTKVSRAIEQVALQSIGLEGPIGRGTSALLAFGAGTTAVVGFGVALAGLQTIYDAFTAKAREAQEEAAKLAPALIRAGLARDPLAAATHDVETLRDALKAQNDEIDRTLSFRAQLGGVLVALGPVGQAINPFGTVLDQFPKVVAAAKQTNDALTEGVRQVGDVENRLAKEHFDRLTQSIALGQASLQQQNEAAARLSYYQSLLKRGIADEETRFNVQARVNQLIDAQRAAQQRVTDATRGTIEAQRDLLAASPARELAAQAGAAATSLLALRDGGRDVSIALIGATTTAKALGDALNSGTLTTADFTTTLAALNRLKKAIAEVAPAEPIVIDAFLRLDTSGLSKAVDDLAKSLPPIVVPPPLKPTVDGINEVVTAGRGLLQTADAMGAIGAGARQSVDGVLSLLGAIDQVNKAKAAGTSTLSGSIGAAGAVLGIVAGLGSLLGGESEFAKIQRENNTRLRELAQHLDGFAANAGNQQRVGQAAAIAGAPDSAVQRAIQNSFITFQDAAHQVAAVNEALRPLGVTFEQINAVAQANGIQLLSQDGYVVASAFKQVAESVGLTIASLTRFGTSIDAQRNKADLQQRIFDPTAGNDPVKTLERERDLFVQNLGASLTGGIANLDLTTAGGQEAFRDFLKTVFEKAEKGLKAGELGTFGSLDALLPDLGTSADALNEILNSVAQAVLNFGTSIDDQRRQMDLQRKLFDPGSLGDATAKLQDDLTLLGNLGPALRAQLAGIDVSTVDGQALLRTFLQNLFTKISTGALTADDLGTFTGLGDLLPVIDDSADALNSFTTSVQQATAEMLNVPTGFKVERARWAATLAQATPQIQPFNPLPGLEIIPSAPLDLATVNGTSGGSTQPIINNTFTGDIIIDGSGDPAATYDAFMAAARQKSLSTFGTTTKWSELR